MDENETAVLLKLLTNSVKRSDWDLVYEAIDYMSEFVESDEDDE